jgi:hypothetical protein
MSVLALSGFLPSVDADLKRPLCWFDAANRARRAFGAPVEAVLRVQDAPRALRASKDRLAIRRLASPNRLNSCAVFLASPL